MFDKISLRKGNIIFLWITFGLIYLIFSCAPAPIKKKTTDIAEEAPPKIESINVISDPHAKETIIEITSSKLISYAAFKLVQPLRIIVDINALPAEGLTGPAVFNGKIIKAINLERIKDKPISTRLVATLTQDVEYDVQEQDRKIKLLLSLKKPAEKKEKEEVTITAIKEEKVEPKEPRSFFSPGKTKLNQVLGVDFFMLPKGKSMVTVTTSKKAEYELSWKNSRTLLLEIKGSSIPPELSRYIDSSQFKGVVNRITPIVKVAERQVDLEIELKEMVPYHVVQAEKEIRLDFNKTSIKPPAKKITKARLTKAPSKPKKMPNEPKPAIISPLHPLKGKAARITLDFAKADIRNILKLIGEVSNLNIVWGPEVKGTVSMRLKNVPWDQALDIVLETNNLGTRIQGNIIWVTTKKKIAKLEKEKEAKRRAELEKIRTAKAAQKEAKAAEPLITAYIPVDFAKAEEIKEHIVLSERGKTSVDERTNTVIITDIASKIEEAKKIVRQFDAPVKQIMIEARIVEASTSFGRDLGVRWDSVERRWQERPSMNWGTDPTQFTSDDDKSFYGSFSSNAPGAWAPNLGLTFATLTQSGAGTLSLDASLALAETEGKITIISAPKIIASNGKSAKIERGDTFYLPAAENVEAKEVQAKLILEVTPTVSYNNYVTLDLKVKDEVPETSEAEEPGKKGKELETTLIVKSGDTVVIGGIYRETKQESESGIPGLSKLPIIGWLFKAQTKLLDRSELLIFLTPTVLSHVYKAQK
jgi:type IV pilus assembly protein PilQ